MKVSFLFIYGLVRRDPAGIRESEFRLTFLCFRTTHVIANLHQTPDVRSVTQDEIHLFVVAPDFLQPTVSIA